MMACVGVSCELVDVDVCVVVDGRWQKRKSVVMWSKAKKARECRLGQFEAPIWLALIG